MSDRPGVSRALFCQPILNHCGGNFITAFLGVRTRDVRPHNHGEILFRREPHHHIPHRVRAIVRQRRSARPAPLHNHPATGVLPAGGRRVEFNERFGFRNARQAIV